VTTERGPSASASATGGFAQAWQSLRADADIQFAPITPPERAEAPGWTRAFLEFLSEIFGAVGNAFRLIGQLLGLSGQVLTWLVIGLGLAILAYLVWRVMEPLRHRRRAGPAIAPEWQPRADEALALLEDADRLAAGGLYDEATHLLLKRSVGQIAEARPGLLEPSATAREIAELRDLPQPARTAFRTIAERVERSLFGLRSLSADDWQQARAAYAEFALAVPRA